MEFNELSKRIDWNAISNKEIVVCDLETTGFDPKENKIIEIGCVRMRPSYERPESFNALINIGEPLSDEITQLTGISDNLLETEGVPFYKAIGDFKTFLGSSDAAAYNSKFDKSFISALCAKYNIPFSNYMPDVMITCIKAFKLKGKKLSDVAEHLGIDTSGAHRALTDCNITLACYMQALIAIQTEQRNSKI